MTYVGVGIVVIALTLIAGTSPQRGSPPLVGLLIGAIFVAIFGVIIYSYAWVTRVWARRIIVILTGIFVVTNTLRMFQYLINFVGFRLELHFKAPLIAIHPSEFSFPLHFLDLWIVNGLHHIHAGPGDVGSLALSPQQRRLRSL